MAELPPLPTLRASIPEDLAGERIDKVLARLFPDYSRSRLQSWLEAGQVKVDGVVAKPRQAALAFAEVVLVPQHAPETLAFLPEPVPLDVVYEDDHIAVICKPAGLVVHPGAGNWQGTLLNGLLHRYGAQAAALPRAGIVHRLDKETSGLMVVARTLVAQTDLIRQLQARTVKRRYVCLVWGTPREESGTVDAPIGRDPRERMRMAVVHGNAGKAARTHYRVVDTGMLDARKVAVLWCDLETGRTHQIRVHCKHIGHPLVGDTLYAKQAPRGRTGLKHAAAVTANAAASATALAKAAAANAANAENAPEHQLRPGRQALHAWALGLRHPETGEFMRWQADAPADMVALAAAAEVTLFPEDIEGLDEHGLADGDVDGADMLAWDDDFDDADDEAQSAAAAETAADAAKRTPPRNLGRRR